MGRHNPSDGSNGRRVRMPEDDKTALRANLAFTFRLCGATDAQVSKVFSSGSIPIDVWISRWICHHTDYETAGLTSDNYKKGFFAWVYYKTAVDIIDSLDISDAVRKENLRNIESNLERVRNELYSNKGSEQA